MRGPKGLCGSVDVGVHRVLEDLADRGIECLSSDGVYERGEPDGPCSRFGCI